ncbi:MAG TPA: phosphodiester glycosidase family protein [Humisphaera sp.]|nr:phosphodiester glycosidase family protein [Humisphaera sp.]
MTISHVSRSGQTFAVAEIDLKQVALQLFWKNASGQRFANFESLKSELHKRHRKMLFATNAGIFDPTFTPLGLHVEEGQVLVPLNRDAGAGNFYLKPNGVFLVNRQGAQIVQTEKFAGPTNDTILATQSGPMLLIDGVINPLFPQDSRNRHIRSGVGVGLSGQVYFAISTEPVTFNALAALFRDSLHCQQALYLDGAISRFYTPQDGKPEQQENFAGILAATVAE